MGASALRIAACAGVLVGGLILGGSGAGLASADPDGVGQGSHERESSKGVNNERPSLTRIIHRILSEHRKLTSNAPRRAPRAKIGSEPDSGFTASESNMATFAEPGDDPDPELLGDNERGAEPGGAEEGSDGIGGQNIDGGGQTEIGGGSDYVDNTVAAAASEAEKKPAVSVGLSVPVLLAGTGRRRLVGRGPDHLAVGEGHQPVQRVDAHTRTRARTCAGARIPRTCPRSSCARAGDRRVRRDRRRWRGQRLSRHRFRRFTRAFGADRRDPDAAARCGPLPGIPASRRAGCRCSRCPRRDR